MSALRSVFGQIHFLLSKVTALGAQHSISRREFVAGASGLVLAGSVANAATANAANGGEALAIDGGKKAVTTKCAVQPRWGEPEQKQLEAMLRQATKRGHLYDFSALKDDMNNLEAAANGTTVGKCFANLRRRR